MGGLGMCMARVNFVGGLVVRPFLVVCGQVLLKMIVSSRYSRQVSHVRPDRTASIRWAKVAGHCRGRREEQ